MGFNSASEIIEPILKYVDRCKLWTNQHVMHIIEKLAITLKDMDWDTDEDMWKYKSFREMCAKSQYTCFCELHEYKTKNKNDT